MDFSYDIVYKSAAHTLSRVGGAEVLWLALSSDLENRIQARYQLDPFLLEVIIKIQAGMTNPTYTFKDSLLRKNNKLVVDPDKVLRKALISWQHIKGRELTVTRLKQLFYWKGLTREVSQFVRNCSTCQAVKYEPVAYPGLLHPLRIPNEVWVDISMEFISGFPKTSGKDVIMVVVDRLISSIHNSTSSSNLLG